MNRWQGRERHVEKTGVVDPAPLYRATVAFGLVQVHDSTFQTPAGLTSTRFRAASGRAA